MDYNQHRDNMARRSREARAKAAEIGPLPEVANQERKSRCQYDLVKFCEEYRPEAFNLGWSRDHIRCIERMQKTCTEGGLFALAMPRGSGKTTITITAAIWSLLYGHRDWVCLIGATGDRAEKLLESIKTELRFNPRLAEDFPEVCYPIVKLEGQGRRTTGQTLNGKETNIVWRQGELVLPHVDGSPASGGVVSVCGITGDIRGQQRTTPEGRVMRPKFVILDDPQTNESAKSKSQTDTRLEIIKGDVMGLAGPGVKISGVMPCTVIRREDVADQLLDRERSPEWNGERTQMLYGWPKNMKLWERYNEIRETEMRNSGTGEEATAFYIEHREDMDDGCEAAWVDRFNEDEESAIQNAMNLYFYDEAAFRAEYQNEPIESSEDDTLSQEEIANRTNAYKRGTIPAGCDVVTAMIDVQKELLFYTVVAWKKDFTGYVIDYGAWPKQRTNNFRLSNARKTISKEYPGVSFEVRLKKSLEALVEHICGRAFTSEDGTELSVRRCLIDANWNESTEVVYTLSRESNHRVVLFPSHGRGIGASQEPMNAKVSKQKNATLGTHWQINKRADSPVRRVVYDTNYWKSFFHSRLSTEPGTRGSVTLFEASPMEHRTLAAHCKAEYAVRTEGRGRQVDEWKLRADRPDNHWFDCLVGSCVAASIEGCTMTDRKKLHSRKRVQRQKAVSYL